MQSTQVIVVIVVTLSALYCAVDARPKDKKHWWDSDEWDQYFKETPGKQFGNQVGGGEYKQDPVSWNKDVKPAGGDGEEKEAEKPVQSPGLTNPAEENKVGDKYEEYNKFVDDNDLEDYDDYEDEDYDEDEDDLYSSEEEDEEEEKEEEEKDYKEIDEAKADKSASEKVAEQPEPTPTKTPAQFDTGIVEEEEKSELEKQQLREQKETSKETRIETFPDPGAHSVKKDLMNPSYMKDYVNTKPDLKTSPNPPPPGLVEGKVAMVTPSGKKHVDLEGEKESLIQSSPLTMCEVNADCRVGRMCHNGICYCLPPSGCERHYKPVCGSDNILYPSHCELHRTACTRKQHIKIDHSARCSKTQEDVATETKTKALETEPVIDRSEIDIDSDIPQAALKSVSINSGEIYDYPKGSPKSPPQEPKYIDNKVDGASKVKDTGVEGKGEARKGECTRTEYEKFKQRLLEYHCQKFTEPNCRTDVQEEREYLAMLMFSFYDWDLDMSLDQTEADKMEAQQHFERLSTNCVLSDIVRYADTNTDGLLTVTEFIAAFNGSMVVRNLRRDPEVIPTLATVGNGLELTCGIESDNIVWRRFNSDIHDLNNDELSVFEDGSLFFSKVGVHHMGNYTCEDGNNPIHQQIHSLRVQMMPIVKMSPHSQMTKSDSTVILKCHAEGIPRPKITWQVNKKSIPDVPKHFLKSHENATLTVQKTDYLSDSGAYQCIAENQAGKAHDSSSLYIQNPNDSLAYTNSHLSYGSFLAFHNKGYSVYRPESCLLERHVLPDFGNFKFIPDNIDEPLQLCNRDTGCEWGTRVNVKDFIYVSQPKMNRVVVVEVKKKWNPIQVIDTDKHPMELHYVEHLDQVWVLCRNSQSGSTLKTIVVIRDASKNIQHHAVHTQPIGNRFDMVQDLFLPSRNDLQHSFSFGYVTHNAQQGLFKLDLRTMKYVKAIDFSAYNCVPKTVVYVPIGGHVIVECVTMATQETTQLVMDYLTDSVVSKKPLAGKPYVSPDSRYVVTVDDFNGKLSVLTVSNEGTLESEFEVTLSCSISDVVFFASPSHIGYDVVLTSADDEDVFFLSLNNGKLDKVKGLSVAGRDWRPEPRKKTLVAGGLFNNFLMSSLPDSVRVIDGKLHKMQCTLDDVINSHVLAFSEN